MRLDKFISEATGISRAQSRTLILRGKVMVEGQVCKKADTQVQPTQAITAEGKALTHEEAVYLMLNKPSGVVSASKDKTDKTVAQLVQADFPRRELFPAGRLDKTSTGFVLLTDDGVFAHDILAPKRHVSKTYTVTVDIPITPEMVQGFTDGVVLASGEQMKPAQLLPSEDPFVCTVVLTQGVYHQIKRMFGVYGAGVNGLHRVAIGGLTLDPDLKPGEWKKLTPAELACLKEDKPHKQHP